MTRKRLQLLEYWYNRTVVAACGFMTAQYCDDFEPKVVIDLLQLHYRSRVSTVVSTEEEFGRIGPNGDFDGFLGEIQRGSYDIALAHIGISDERFDTIGFTRPYDIGGIKFAVSKGSLEDVSSALIRPFKFEVWLVLFFSVSLCCVGMRYRARKFGVRISLSSTIMILWGTFLQKGSRTQQCLRIPLLFWGILSFMLAQWYLASLQSLLTSPSRVPVISTLHELSTALSGTNHARICLQRDSFAQYIVEISTSPLSKLLRGALKEDSGAISSLQDCEMRLRKEKNLAVLVEGARFSPTADEMLSHPQVQTSIDKFYTILTAAASAKNSPSLKYFDQLIGTLMEAGIFLKNRSMREHKRATPPTEERIQPRGESILRNCLGFTFAFGAGIFTLILEMLACSLGKSVTRWREESADLIREFELSGKLFDLSVH